MQKQWMKLNLNIISFVYVGCHLELPHKKAFSSSLSGWAFGTFVKAMGWSYDPCKCINIVYFVIFSNFEYQRYAQSIIVYIIFVGYDYG